MITIKLNGKDENVKEKFSLLKLLEDKKIVPDTVVVALNMNVVNQTELDKTFLSNGDSVEVLRFVAGG
ncbi:sulfur carrier protein ThiS [Candidatus Endomicrobiellum devescovinae]|jgi:sulfur carrier protein|uniref:sulfur carrier protein ThiS n=1 Tax=Candidatus Endomicrobiellum devescovinae TaxID=3242322 RepID=UPI00283841D3|nr:sulfur carrier protein ThiS [Endomicrobium sp.]MDR1433896.1 sulfur carrier protein ThiS [Endomicrobium sp.]MDR2818672.1 sulfur carrier protein ThiS [Endomicrobium sp.]